MKFGWNCRDAENHKLFMETIRARNAEIYAASAADAPKRSREVFDAGFATVAPVEQSERSLMLEARRILMLLHDPSTHGPNYAAVENEIAATLRSIICAAYEDAAVIAENCSQDEAARDEPFRIAQTIREQVRRLFATRVVPAPSAAIQDETARVTCANCGESIIRDGNEWDHEFPYKPECSNAVPASPSSTHARAAARAIASALERDEVPHHVEESEPFIAAIIERCLSEGEA